MEALTKSTLSPGQRLTQAGASGDLTFSTSNAGSTSTVLPLIALPFRGTLLKGLKEENSTAKRVKTHDSLQEITVSKINSIAACTNEELSHVRKCIENNDLFKGIDDAA